MKKDSNTRKSASKPVPAAQQKAQKKKKPKSWEEMKAANRKKKAEQESPLDSTKDASSGESRYTELVRRLSDKTGVHLSRTIDPEALVRFLEQMMKDKNPQDTGNMYEAAPWIKDTPYDQSLDIDDQEWGLTDLVMGMAPANDTPGSSGAPSCAPMFTEGLPRDTSIEVSIPDPSGADKEEKKDGTDTDETGEVSKRIVGILSLIQEAQDAYSEAVKIFKEEDRLSLDLLHYIEFESDPEVLAGLAADLHASRKRRRAAKDRKEVLQPVIEYISSIQYKNAAGDIRQMLEKVKKAEKSHMKRTYCPRAKKAQTCEME